MRRGGREVWTSVLMGCVGAVWHRMQLGCSAALAQMQRGLHWHAHGSHVPQGTQGTSTVVHSWCTHTLYSNLVGMATDTWADTPWSNSWGVLYPSRVTTPFLSYSFYELVDSVSWHVLYSSLCGCAGLGRLSRDVVVTRFGVKLKNPNRDKKVRICYWPDLSSGCPVVQDLSSGCPRKQFLPD